MKKKADKCFFFLIKKTTVCTFALISAVTHAKRNISLFSAEWSSVLHTISTSLWSGVGRQRSPKSVTMGWRLRGGPSQKSTVTNSRLSCLCVVAARRRGDKGELTRRGTEMDSQLVVGKYTHLSQTSNSRQCFSDESNNVSSPSRTSFKPPDMTVSLGGVGR